jgi:hypothetical protein
VQSIRATNAHTTAVFAVVDFILIPLTIFSVV